MKLKTNGDKTKKNQSVKKLKTQLVTKLVFVQKLKKKIK